MIELFGYFSVLLRGTVLVCEALAVGGLIYLFAIARGDARDTFSWPLLTVSSALLGIAQSSHVAVTSAVLLASSDMTWRDVIGAAFWIAGGLVAVGALTVLVSLRNRGAPRLLLPACVAACALVLAGSVMA